MGQIVPHLVGDSVNRMSDCYKKPCYIDLKQVWGNFIIVIKLVYIIHGVYEVPFLMPYYLLICHI